MARKSTNIKSDLTDSKEVKRGYNENNPGQPQGAFKPDAATAPKKAPPKKNPRAK